MFCKHKWELLSEYLSESTVEKAILGGLVVKKARGVDFAKKHIQVFQCSSCGKLKRFVEVV